MARYNKPPKPLAPPIVSVASPTARTGNNAPGFIRDAKSELYLMAVSNFGMDKAYETAVAGDVRFKSLVREVAAADPDWTKRFLPYLRNEANMRTASMVGLVEAVEAMVKAKIPGGRQMTYFTITRADEPGEVIAYLFNAFGRKTGRRICKPIKRGIADAIQGLYGEYQTLKYDTESHGVRFGDVLELCHPKPRDYHQSVLFKYLIDRRHKREGGIPSSLTMMHKNAWLREQVAKGNTDLLLDTHILRDAGMTWEDALSLAGTKVPKRKLWEALIPTMGYMALLRNLRNFDEALVSNEMAQQVHTKLTNPEAVAQSRQLPMRFLSAFRSVSNVRWHMTLETALEYSLSNIPEFKGRTLILIDTSGSMADPMSDRSELRRWDAAAIFGLALARRCESADVVSFSDRSIAFPLQKGASLLVMLEAFRRGYFQGHGTSTEMAVRTNFNHHDRVVILTDEMANHHTAAHVGASIPTEVPLITFNLAGYKVGHAPSGTATRITIGGLSDQAFKLLHAYELRANGGWPF